jgi:glycosyltransferase involved in cell wall biosynthesis
LRGRKELLLSLDAIPIPYHPYVTICQNQLPFDVHERQRFGFSLTHLRLKLLSWSQTKAFRQADGIIYLTQASAMGVFQFAPDLAQIPYQVVHHGLHRRFWDRHLTAPSTAGLRTSARLLYVSIINLYKHQWVVAEAVLQLAQEGHTLSLDLVGPAYPPALRRLEKVLSKYPDASKTVRYMGPQAYAAMDQLIRDADILLFASTCETFGLTLLEAMASGKPVLASDIPVARELIGDNAGFFNPENVESVKAAILEALQHPEAALQKANRAYELVPSFSWQKTADETFSFLQAIARKTST